MDKKTIMISIRPEHVKNIINGNKKFEYRTKAAKEEIGHIIIYSTYPDKVIVAEAEIIKILKQTPEELWASTKTKSGIDKKFFNKYFYNRTIAYAYEIGKVKVYKKPKKLIDFGLKYAPQSYVYIKNRKEITKEF